MSHKLVIYSLVAEPHCVLVAELLLERGIEVYFFDPSISYTASIDYDCPRLTCYQFRGRKSGDPKSWPVEVDLREAVVWWRLKLSFEFLESEEHQLLYYHSSESKHLLNALLTLSDARVFNDRDAVRRFGNKALQLKIARECGFEVPATRVTNDKAIISGLEASHGDLISKPFGTSYIPPTIGDGFNSRLMFTTPINSVDIPDASASLQPVSIVQERIEKRIELRVIVFGEEVVAFTVSPPDTNEGNLDWRLTQEENVHALYDLDPVTKAKCAEYLKRSGLDYGVFDFIVDKAGRIVFLECNPDGQWAWLERELRTTVIREMFARGIATLLDTAAEHDPDVLAEQAG